MASFVGVFLVQRAALLDVLFYERTQRNGHLGLPTVSSQTTILRIKLDLCSWRWSGWTVNDVHATQLAICVNNLLNTTYT